MNKIRIGDFPLGRDERNAIHRVVESGRITEHREVRAFEEEFSAWLGVKHCIAVSSGTAALMVGLTVLKHTHDLHNASVLIPALTFIATANAIHLCGMRPIFGDIDPATLTLTPTYNDCDIVLPVHLFGYTADMNGIRAGSPNAIIVEDACEAHGSHYRGHKVGTLGLWATFSFYIAHTVQAGELGVLVTNNDEIARVARQLKAHGRECACKICTRSTGQCPNMSNHDPRYYHVIPGFNFKPMEFQAALARVQLKKIDDNIARRYRNVNRLNRKLKHLEDKLILPMLDNQLSYMAYPVIIFQPGIRNQVLLELESRGVECRPLFGCIPTQQPAFSYLKHLYEYKLPVAEYYGANGFFVGCHQYLTDDDIDYMSKVISETIERFSDVEG